jgi:hypothetical protein
MPDLAPLAVPCPAQSPHSATAKPLPEAHHDLGELTRLRHVLRHWLREHGFKVAKLARRVGEKQVRLRRFVNGPDNDRANGADQRWVRQYGLGRKIIQAPGITGFLRISVCAPKKFALFLSFLPGLAQLPPRNANLAPIPE